MVRGIFLVMCLLSVGLAGCTETGDAELGAGLGGSSTVDRIEGEAAGNGLNGTINGTALNKAGFALSGATALLVELGITQETDAQGNFVFASVPPGLHTLRVERSTYKAFQKELDVIGGETLLIEVVMATFDDVDPDSTDHVHDYWVNLDSMVIMDEEIDLSGGGTAGSGDVTRANLDGTGNYAMEFDFPTVAAHPPETAPMTPALVFPGTERVEFTMTWSSDDVSLSELSFMIDPIGGDETWFDKAPSGTVYTMPIGEDAQTDRGHSKQSRWSFGLRSDNDPTKDGYEPGMFGGPVHIKIEVFKADVPLEEAHPRPWADGPCIQLRTFGDSGSPPNPAGISPQSRPGGKSGSTSMGPHGTVAPGSTNISITFHWTIERNGLLDDTPVDDWSIRFTTASEDGSTMSMADMHTPDLVSEDVAAQTKVYSIEVEDGWEDSWYDSRTLWALYPVDDNTWSTPARDQLLPDWFALQYNFYYDVVVCNRDLM